MAKVFPNYHRELKPKIIYIQTQVGQIRAQRVTNDDLGKNGNSEERQKHIKFLLFVLAQVESMIPDLVNYENAEKEEKKIIQTELRAKEERELKEQREKEERDNKFKLFDRFLWFLGGIVLAIKL